MPATAIDLTEYYAEFWDWFQEYAAVFHKVVKDRTTIDENFFQYLAPMLDEVKEGFYYATGMRDENTAELIITADGAVKNFVFVEELIAAAPAIEGWVFTPLSPGTDVKGRKISMDGYTFDDTTLFFYSNSHEDYPDHIDLTIVYTGLTPENQQTIRSGIFIFLENELGELYLATGIDGLNIVSNAEATQDLIPISKLKDFLAWRETEFVEKYKATRRDTENDTYALMEADLENGNLLVAHINIDLLYWDSKASHPWIATVTFNFGNDGKKGMPDENTEGLLQMIEDDMLAELKDHEGYLHFGKDTSEGVRHIYFACKEFRRISKVLYGVQIYYQDDLPFTYEIVKEKYWQSFNKYMNNDMMGG